MVFSLEDEFIFFYFFIHIIFGSQTKGKPEVLTSGE